MLTKAVRVYCIQGFYSFNKLNMILRKHPAVSLLLLDVLKSVLLHGQPTSVLPAKKKTFGSHLFYDKLETFSESCAHLKTAS